MQTTFVETGTSQELEEEMRQRIQRELHVEDERAQRDKELEEESLQLDREIEQEIRGKHEINPSHRILISWPELTEEERASILAAPEFLDFVEQSSKIVQRALNDGYDYIRDYTISGEAGACVHHTERQNQSFPLFFYIYKVMIQRGSVSSAFANSTTKDMEGIGQLQTLTGHPR